jgi:hypothetical protein
MPPADVLPLPSTLVRFAAQALKGRGSLIFFIFLGA